MTKNLDRFQWLKVAALIWATALVAAALLTVNRCNPEEDTLMSGELRDGCNSLCLENKTEAYPFDHEHCIWSCIANSTTDPKE